MARFIKPRKKLRKTIDKGYLSVVNWFKFQKEGKLVRQINMTGAYYYSYASVLLNTGFLPICENKVR